MNAQPSTNGASFPPPDERLALLREIVELLTAIHNLQNEQLHVLRSIKVQMP